MSRHRAVPFRRRSAPMRPDDRVGPGIRRRAGFVAIAVSCLLFGIGLPIGFGILTGVAQNAEQTAGLSRDEVAELRSYLTGRREAREKEAAQVQAQLDEQNAVLCAALAEVAKDASAQGRATLARAGKSLGCPALPARQAPSSSSSPSSEGSSTSGSPATEGAPARSPAARAPTSGGGSATAPSSPPPAPTPTPTDRGSDRGPITGTVCDLLGICL
ncbi:hypothetical protein G7075_20010 [Phycicoccus sp. HDW14]|uniref:hypothetical protein n=1 Tax=Phycicoccus sp. HDW14 TaxID=2714941 RepID=UPI00140D2B55|nr:hypothetical protein [Phycicoccus sp. HDW14]QIM20532.1 hypothetical protein G7075_04260 [Phycicoccus sp. HDW14]QIM22880.1 hypothetical protein G7075_20010 [Phycicoccus sp. HDW14]